jgi:YgiT-type zinc finger domain-containing protein
VRRERSKREEESAMSATSSTQCTACLHGELTPTRLTVTLTYGGKSVSVDVDDALVCNACGEQFIGERAAAFLLSQRALAPDVAMTATVRRRTESG